MERSLRQFLVVAETGSISAASRQLNVTQPTITVNIRNLEEKYRVALFKRTPKGMALTPYGSILLEKTRIMARLENQANREIENLRLGARSVVRVGCGHAWWRLFVREAVENTVSGMVDASVYVENGSNLHCMWKLLSGEIMASVGHRIRNLAPGVEAVFSPLFPVKDAYFVSEDHPLLSQDCTRQDLDGLTWVHSVPMDSKYSEILTVQEEQAFDGPAIMSSQSSYCSNSIVTCADMVKHSGGFTMFPENMEETLAPLGLVPLRMDVIAEQQEIGIYYLKERQGDTDLEMLVQEITESAGRYEQQRL